MLGFNVNLYRFLELIKPTSTNCVDGILALPLPGRLYAYEFCSCRYESDFMVVSLHRTKAGAYKAMRTGKINHFNEGLNNPWRKQRVYDALGPDPDMLYRVRKIFIEEF